MSRTCGECIACCTYLRIAPLGKPGLSHCHHAWLAGEPKGNQLFFQGKTDAKHDCGNCSIHGQPARPDVCEDYKCAWLLGYGNEDDRPDKSGMLVDTVQNIENCWEAKPIWAGAQDRPNGYAAVERISRDSNRPVAVASFPERHMVRIVGRGV